MRFLTLIVLALGLTCWQANASGNYEGSSKRKTAAAKKAAPVKLCLKCGEIKGSAVCCVAEGRSKCTKCDLFKGSVGCCKIPTTICTGCGEIKGTAKCCAAEGRTKCGGCGMFKGAPACCKIDKKDAGSKGKGGK
jgi:hypothetical protein